MSIQLELGKTYLNRRGEQVKIIKHEDDDNYPLGSACGRYYRDNGIWFNTDKPRDLDLIEEVLDSTPAAASASDFLQEARDSISEHGKQYDPSSSDRSMSKTVAAFNVITGQNLTEAEGWLFMSVLKTVSQFQNNPHLDSSQDGVVYAALLAEVQS